MTGRDGGAGPGAGHGWRWDVALSFADAQRPYVEQVAAALQARGLRCFYDADEQIELWGRYLAEELPRIYAEESAAAVVFVSAEYADRDWARLERRAALDRAVRERREYVLPDLDTAAVLPGPRAGRRRRLAGPDPEFRAFGTRRRMPACPAPRLERAGDTGQAGRYQRGEISPAARRRR